VAGPLQPSMTVDFRVVHKLDLYHLQRSLFICIREVEDYCEKEKRVPIETMERVSKVYHTYNKLSYYTTSLSYLLRSGIQNTMLI
jgi:hypothetical protein